jgi:hypothetical protein
MVAAAAPAAAGPAPHRCLDVSHAQHVTVLSRAVAQRVSSLLVMVWPQICSTNRTRQTRLAILRTCKLSAGTQSLVIRQDGTIRMDAARLTRK